MRLPTILSTLLLSILIGGCIAQKGISDETLKVNGFKLYYSLSGEPKEVRDMFRLDGFNRIVLINQRNLDARKEWTLNRKVLTEFVEKQITNPKDDVLIVLDWEGEVMDAILKGRQHDEARYDRAAGLMLNAYTLVKTLRPKATVGYYGYPIRNYHGMNERWRMKNLALDDLFSQFDALFPSLYDFYPDDENNTRQARDAAYAEENTLEAIKMGKRLNKPVLPFIWHRYHPSHKKKGWEPIPKDEFQRHLFTVLSAKVDETHVDGIVWWGSDWSQFATRNKRKIERKELRGRWEDEAKVLFPLYYNAIKEVSGDVQRR